MGTALLTPCQAQALGMSVSCLDVSLGTYPLFLVNSNEIRKPNKGTLHIREG